MRKFVSGNPLTDITELPRVKFVMKGGKVIRDGRGIPARLKRRFVRQVQRRKSWNRTIATSNPKSEISNCTRSDLIFRISDLKFAIVRFQNRFRFDSGWE